MATMSQNIKQAAQNFEEEFVDEAQAVAKKAGSHLRDEAETIGAKASSVATQAADKVKNAASYVGEKAEQATGAVGAGMESLGSTIRSHEPEKGFLHNAGEAVADKLEGAGHYLENQGLKGIGADVTNLIRRNPIPALLVGVGLGFLLARMVRR